MSWTEADIEERNRRVFGEGRARTQTDRASKGVAAEAAPDTLELPIQEEVTIILQQDGWRALRTDPVSDRGRGKGFGEVGMADYLYVRYWSATMNFGPNIADVMWIEFKRSKGGVVSKAQRAWHIRERARGALTLIAGEDFPASVEGFCKWYAASGLQRRKDL